MPKRDKKFIENIFKQGVDAICFDVDSTVSPHEGIDELAHHLNVADEVSRITKEAMDGKLDFRQALEKRIEVMGIKRDDIATFLKLQPPILSSGIATLVEMLQHSNIKVYLISGGFRDFINPLAAELNIPITNVIANTFIFSDSNPDAIATFDPNEPTSKSGGKAVAINNLIENSQNTIKTVVMVGDGMTDVEARPPAAAMIGYGGVVCRDKVKESCDWFVTSFDEISSILPTINTSN